MIKRAALTGMFLLTAIVTGLAMTPGEAEATQPGQPNNWQRFYYYPYVYYPQNFRQGRTATIICTTATRRNVGFRCTTRTGTTSIQVSVRIIPDTTSFLTCSDFRGRSWQLNSPLPTGEAGCLRCALRHLTRAPQARS